ncbi:MAG TPA: DUF6298 domain-containing protein, partial [Gemmatimonadales bacterium]|nr:DUF6298 domain-containing protein [Gemmatimonadales bacterium]
FLTGSHTWLTLQDAGFTDPPPRFDYGRFLDFLVAHNHNFLRLYTWEEAKWTNEAKSPYWFEPLPFLRTGPGLAMDDKPRFDLTRLDPQYFLRLRERVAAAGARGIYVSIMLFNGWSIDQKSAPGANPWVGHPFNRANNVNGVDGDPYHTGYGRYSETLRVPGLVAVQEDYIRHVVDAVSDLDNVLYEITNEGDSTSLPWQYHMVYAVKRFERGKPKHHPVGITAPWPSLPTNAALFASPADWISPDGRAGAGQLESGAKVIIYDTDHLCSPCTPPGFAWKALTAGLNPILMDPYLVADSGMGVAPTYRSDDPGYELLRKSLGYALTYANRVDLKRMRPRPDLAGTGHCLASTGPDGELLVYLPKGDTVTVDLRANPGPLRAEWFSPARNQVVPAPAVPGGSSVTLRAPLSGEAVLYLSGRRQVPR